MLEATHLDHLGQLLLWHMGGQERQQRQGGIPDEAVIRAQHAGHGGLKIDSAAEGALSLVGKQGAQRTQRQLESICPFSVPAHTDHAYHHWCLTGRPALLGRSTAFT